MILRNDVKTWPQSEEVRKRERKYAYTDRKGRAKCSNILPTPKL